MPQILTFTANLLAETTYQFGDWKSATTQRAKSESFQVGGKGINVSKMLTRFGAYNEAICFPGGPYGAICLDWLKQNKFRVRSYPENCITRSGAVIRSERISETTFLGLDSQVSTQAVEKCIADLSEHTNHFVLAICGKIQDWEDSQWDSFRDFIQSRRTECHLAVDTYGPALKWLLNQKPELVKINRSELESLAGDRAETSTPDLIDALAQHHSVRDWIITNGAEEIWYKHKKAPSQSLAPPKTICVSATGCGDVFFATTLNELYNKKSLSLENTIAKAADYASRNAAKPTIAEFTLD
ncbi:PfkB family carbohydrate kinase [Puniceicoccaceae bacterium K14]|nr:PfkB family carbohydrate kinase [Puniceicoccaceae bacterium K14]